jgi:hypothetical protein
MTCLIPIKGNADATLIAVVVPDEVRLIDASRRACRLGLMLATNGERCLMVRQVPAGWTRIRTREKNVHRETSNAAA